MVCHRALPRASFYGLPSAFQSVPPWPFQGRPRTLAELPPAFQDLPRPSRSFQGPPPRRCKGPSNTFHGRPKSSTGASKGVPERSTVVPGRTQDVPRPFRGFQQRPRTLQWRPSRPSPETFQGLVRCFRRPSKTVKQSPEALQGFPRAPWTSNPPARAAGSLALPATRPCVSHSGVAIVRARFRGIGISCIPGRRPSGSPKAARSPHAMGRCRLQTNRAAFADAMAG